MRPTRSQLGAMALDAAIDIERHQKSKSSDMLGLNTFFSALSDSDVQDSIFEDEALYPYYTAALSRVDDADDNGANFADMFRHILSQRTDEDKSLDEMEKVKNFCLAFHQAMALAAQNGRPTRHNRDGRL